MCVEYPVRAVPGQAVSPGIGGGVGYELDIGRLQLLEGVLNFFK